VATYTRERPGMSAFVLEDGAVYRTYSTYARGLDGLWGMYQWLDRAPKGRNETGFWFRRHDEYDKRWVKSWIVVTSILLVDAKGYQKIEHQSNILLVINFTKIIWILPEIIIGYRKWAKFWVNLIHKGRASWYKNQRGY